MEMKMGLRCGVHLPNFVTFLLSCYDTLNSLKIVAVFHIVLRATICKPRKRWFGAGTGFEPKP
jgi:hypothetical protein